MNKFQKFDIAFCVESVPLKIEFLNKTSILYHFEKIKDFFFSDAHKV